MTMAVSLLMTAQVFAQDEIALINKFEQALVNVTDTETKYTTDAVNIRREPNVESEILDVGQRGSSFEIAVVIDGWAMIVTEDGYAYMKTDWFSDEPVTVNSYTDEDLYILTHLLTGEAHTYSDEEQRYVASVVMNRVNHPSYPNTIKGVAFQKGQYACTWDGNYYRTPTDRNWANARYILENGSVFPGDVVYQSGGRQGSGVHLKTSKHYYCYY